MKVLQILPELNAGGVERGTLEVAAHLVREGHEAWVVSNGGRLVEELEAYGARHVAMPVHRKSPWTLLQVARLRKRLREIRPDILHIRSRVPGWVAWLAWRGLEPETRPRLVSTVHGFYSVNTYSAVMTKGERVICVSNSVRDYVRQNYPGVIEDRIRVIHRGVNPDHFPFGFKPDPKWLDRWHEDFPLLKGKRVITLPARITRWKGGIEFVSVIAGLLDKGHPVCGLIVGEPHPRKKDYHRELLRTISKAGLEEKIFLPGHRSDLREIMAVSDVVVSLSSDPEAFGRVSLEALSLGRPVAAFDHGGVGEQLAELLPEGGVPAGNVHAMIDLMDSWLSGSLPLPARENPFTLERMVSQTLATYEDLWMDKDETKVS